MKDLLNFFEYLTQISIFRIASFDQPTARNLCNGNCPYKPYFVIYMLRALLTLNTECETEY